MHNSFRLACQTLPNSAQAHYNLGEEETVTLFVHLDMLWFLELHMHNHCPLFFHRIVYQIKLHQNKNKHENYLNYEFHVFSFLF